MDPQFPSVMIPLVLIGIAVAFLFYRLLNDGAPPDIPRLSRAGGLGYLITAVRYLLYSREVLDEGAKRFGGRPFALPTLAGWIIILDARYMGILCTGDDRVFDQEQFADQLFQLDHTIAHQAFWPLFHINVIRDMVRNPSDMIPDIVDETTRVFSEVVHADDINIPIYPMVVNAMGRVVQRVLLGEEFSRNQFFLTSVVNFATTLLPYARVLSCFPKAFRRPLYLLLSFIWGGSKEPMAYIIPHIARRLEESPSKRQSNRIDFIDSLIQHAPAHMSTFDLAVKVLAIEFATIDFPSYFVIQALFEISQMSPEVLTSIREEIEQVLEQEKCWDKNGLSRLTKLDSLLREIGRVHRPTLLVMQRLTAADFKLHNGVILPAGYKVALDSQALHFDPQVYPTPTMFDPLRFSKLSEQANDDHSMISKFDLTKVSRNYLPFGTGRHACPGRFFASIPIKIMLSHILLNYDIQLPDGHTTRPENLVFDGVIMPPMKAHLVFKRRARPTKDVIG